MSSHKIVKTVLSLGVLAGSSLIPLTVLGQVPVRSGVVGQSDLTRHRLATLDRDNDGLPDVVEGRAGTNPHNRDTNHNGVWDSDETVRGLGLTYGEAYTRGYYDDDGGDDGDDIGGGDDDGDDSSNSGGSVKRPALPKLTCTKPHQRNCKPAICKAKAKAKAGAKSKKAKSCKPAKKVTPKPKPIGGVTPRPTPKPIGGGTPVPTAKPTPVVPPQTGNFDPNGNTTKFGIPAGTTGNITAGSGVQSSSCNGCHTEKQGRSYAQLKGSLSIGAMSYIKLSTQQIANLTAYLNRLNK